MNYTPIFLAAALSAMAACELSPASNRVNTDSILVTEAPYLKQARVLSFSDSCGDVLQKTSTRNESLGAIAAALVPVISNTAVDYISAKLKAAEEAKTGSFAANGQVLNLDTAGCIAIAKGQFGATPVALSPTGKLTTAAYENLDLQAAPDFLLLIGIRYSKPNLTIEPYYLHYANTSARSAGSGKKDIAVSLALSASSNANDDKNSKAMEKIQIAYKYDEVALGTYLFGETISSSPQRFALNLESATNTVSVGASVTETENPNLALKLFVENFSEKSDDLSKALSDVLTDIVNPSEDESN